MAATPPAARRYFRPIWAEISLAALEANLRRFRSKMGREVSLLFVVKANAYGHGALDCARLAQSKRLAEWLGVSSVEEGIALREGGIRLPILVLGGLYPFESFLAAAEYRLTPTVASLESARRFSDAAARRARPWRCHVKVETGMNRIGVRPEEALRVLRYLGGKAEGLYTHLSCADSDAGFTAGQLKLFRGVVAVAAREGLRPRLRHAANSAGALRFPASRWDMVRPGLALYGLMPGFRPVMSLKTRVVFTKHIAKGAAIGYGATFRARRPSRIATIPAGYADGLSRGLSNKGEVIIRGRRCPVVGAVSMDMATVDVTGMSDVHVGDEATVIGEGQTAGEVARTLGTIPYEVVCGISARVPRKVVPC